MAESPRWSGSEDKGASPTSSARESLRPRSTSSQSTSTSCEYFESVVSMLSILSCSDHSNAHRALLAITNSPESCQALRKAGCIPLLIQILHPVNLAPNEHPSLETKARAARALKNIVHFNPDEKQKRKEMRVVKLLESIRCFSEQVKARPEDCSHPVQSTTTLMKLSFDEEHRLTMCQLGAIHALADLIQADHSAHGLNLNQDCVITRRYCGMTLTNLTFGDGTNKALLCSMKSFLNALVAQLDCPNEDVCQVTASVLRNLSWHADGNSRVTLRDSDVVIKLTTAAIRSSKESTLKATLSALWNLSAHSVTNKTAICHTKNAIEFLIGLLNYKSKTLTIVENAGGILRNIASVIAGDEGARASCRMFGLIEILLEHLRSSSLTVVSNACGTLWHLSANCPQDQKQLLDLGALPKLKALMYSKHERIQQGATVAFKNLVLYSSKQNQSAEKQDIQEPIDLRRTSDAPSSMQDAGSQDEPLDLSMHSSKSSPIHVVSAAEFGAKTATVTPVFLNPPTQTKNSSRNYYSPRNHNSCPELMRFIQPAHQVKALDCSKSETLVLEDTITNYSLHFTESEDPPGIKNEDTIKTYYCEGTPLNFSTSNSMSDLTQVDKQPKLKPIAESEGVEDQPRKYHTEHTPANFSRCSSLSSIASNVQGGENKAEFVEEQPLKHQTATAANAPVKEKMKRNVTFSANETPLMFSRSSSVNSLGSVEVNFEDGGSVVSEFSRRTSEAVSPSELPDSPRQILAPTVVPSFPEKGEVAKGDGDGDQGDGIRIFNTSESAPMTGNASLRSLSPLTIDGETIGVAIKVDSPAVPMQRSTKPTMITKPILKHGRPENSDELKIFAIEGTPFGVSNATSLSDLMCDIDKDNDIGHSHNQIDLIDKIETPENQSKMKVEAKDSIPSSPEDEPIYSDAQILLKCINAGKANRIPKSKSEFNKLNITSPGVKSSTSYHEDLKSDDVDPDLAALIMKGKHKARSLGKPNSQQKEVQNRIVNQADLNYTASVPNEEVKECFNGKLQSIKSATNGSKTPAIQQSTVSSEWNDETPTFSSVSIPSISLSTAFKLVEKKTNIKHDSPTTPKAVDINIESTLTSVQPPSGLSAVSSTECKRKTYTKGNLLNQKSPPELDLENSMISVASLKSEIASAVDLVEEGMNDLSLGAETYVIDGNYDGTDIEESLREDTESLEFRSPEKIQCSRNMDLLGDDNCTKQTPPPDRFLTFTKSQASPKQKRQDDPSRYLTRTITPVDANGNSSSPTTPIPQFATFKVDKPGRATKAAAATSDESSPSTSPRGIRGRRKHLYSSLPSQRKVAPPIPPKPRVPATSSSTVYVRATRSSELRAALSSRDSSPKQSKQSSRNSSTTSLNMSQAPAKKIPPKPPVRSYVPSTAVQSKNFAVVRAVRNSNSSIGFSKVDEAKEHESSLFNTLPRSNKISETVPREKESKVGRLSSFWNQLTKGKSENSVNQKQMRVASGGSGNCEFEDEKKISEKKTRFGIGFSFGKKKKDVWVKREHESGIKEKVEKEKAFVLPFNYTSNSNSAHVNLGNSGTQGNTSTTNSRMTTV